MNWIIRICAFEKVSGRQNIEQSSISTNQIDRHILNLTKQLWLFMAILSLSLESERWYNQWYLMTSNQQISSHEFVLLVVSRQKWTNLIFGHMRLQSRKKKPKPTVVNIESIHFVLYFNHYHVFSFIYIRNELWPFTSYRQKIQWVNLAAKYAIRSRRMNYLTLVYRSHIHVYCYHLMSSEHRESVCSFECYVDWSKVQLVWWGAQNDKNKVKMLNKIRFRFNVLTNRKKWFPCVFFLVLLNRGSCGVDIATNWIHVLLLELLVLLV